MAGNDAEGIDRGLI